MRKMSGNRYIGIASYEYAWLADRKLNLESEIRKTKCKNTKEKYRGELNEVTIACIDRPRPRIIWWYVGSPCTPKRKNKRPYPQTILEKSKKVY